MILFIEMVVVMMTRIMVVSNDGSNDGSDDGSDGSNDGSDDGSNDGSDDGSDGNNDGSIDTSSCFFFASCKKRDSNGYQDTFDDGDDEYSS